MTLKEKVAQLGEGRGGELVEAQLCVQDDIEQISPLAGGAMLPQPGMRE